MKYGKPILIILEYLLVGEEYFNNCKTIKDLKSKCDK